MRYFIAGAVALLLFVSSAPTRAAAEEDIVFAPLDIRAADGEIAVPFARFTNRYAARRLALPPEEDALLPAALAGAVTGTPDAKAQAGLVAAFQQAGTLILWQAPDAPVADFSVAACPNVEFDYARVEQGAIYLRAKATTGTVFLGVRVRERRNGQERLVTLVHGDAAAWGPLPVTLGGAATPALEPKRGDNDVYVPLGAGFDMARVYPSYEPVHCISLRYKSLENGAECRLDTKLVASLRKKDEMGGEGLENREESDLPKLFVLQDATRRDISDVIGRVEISGGSALLLLRRDQTKILPNTRFYVGVHGEKLEDGIWRPVTFIHADTIGNPRSMTMPVPAFGKYEITADQASEQTILSREEIRDPQTAVKSDYQRDVWHFHVVGEDPSLWRRKPSRSFNNYLKWDLLVSELARDPDSRLALTWGWERSLNNNKLPVRVAVRDWDTRLFGEVMLLSHQELVNRGAVFSVGSQSTLPQPFGSFRTPFLPVRFMPNRPKLSLAAQYPVRLGPRFNGNTERLFAEFDWENTVSMPVFCVPDTNVILKVLLQGWKFVGSDGFDPNNPQRRLGSAGRMELGLLIPTTSRASDTYLNIAYVRGANEASGFQRSQGFRFGVVTR